MLYQDDAQVKLLYASLTTARTPDSQGNVHLQARPRASAINDMELAGELLDGDEDLEDNTAWTEADLDDDPEHEWPSKLARYLPGASKGNSDEEEAEETA